MGVTSFQFAAQAVPPLRAALSPQQQREAERQSQALIRDFGHRALTLRKCPE
jgi:hypothetical protein